MAAPSGTVWGNIITGSKDTRKGRIGIYTNVTSTATTVTVKLEVWFWSMYSVDDSNNNYYYNANATAATTLIGSKDINHTVNTGAGWSTSNQTKLGSSTYTYTKGTSASTKNYAAKFTGIDSLGSGAMTATTSVTVPALASYTVAYNMNGGSGSISSQPKYYGKALILSSTKPTRTGYSFQGWATSASGSVAYASGANYTANAAVTLYAVWKANTYAVTYNANGGTGAPTAQTKTYGKTLKLSTVKPTRDGYNFKGWATSKTATKATYAAGASYTENAAATLYAVWELSYVKPRINGLIISRCDSDREISDEGTYAVVGFSWASDLTVSSIKIEWKLASATSYTNSEPVTASDKKGSVYKRVGGTIDPEKTYTFRITVADGTDDSHKTQKISNLSGSIYHIDCKPPNAEDEVGGVSVGKPAELDGVFDVGFLTKFSGGMINLVAETVADLNEMKTPNTYVTIDKGASSYANIPDGVGGTFTVEVMSAGAEGQVMQRLTTCSKTNLVIFIRHYYFGSWGEWLRIGGHRNIISARLTSNLTITTAKEYTQIPIATGNSLGGSLSVNGGAIEIGAGVKYVKVSANVEWSSIQGNGNKHIRIKRNNDSVMWATAYGDSAGNLVMSLPSRLIRVSEGDLICLYGYSSTANDVVYAGSSTNGFTTYMTVEVVG